MLGPQRVVLLGGGVHLGRKKQRCDFQGDSLSCPMCMHIRALSLPLSLPLAVVPLPLPCVLLSVSLAVCISPHFPASMK